MGLGNLGKKKKPIPAVGKFKKLGEVYRQEEGYLKEVTESGVDHRNTYSGITYLNNGVIRTNFPERLKIAAEAFAASQTNKAIKAEQDRKQTLFGGEIEQQLREKKELLGEAEDPEEIARREFLRRRLLGI